MRDIARFRDVRWSGRFQGWSGSTATHSYVAPQAYLRQTHAYPYLAAFEQLNLWHTCDTVIIRWRSAQEPEIITGNIVMEAVPSAAGSKYPFKIQTVYSEFNSGAWLVNLGVFKPSNCSAGTQPVISQDSNIVKRDGVKLPTIL